MTLDELYNKLTQDYKAMVDYGLEWAKKHNCEQYEYFLGWAYEFAFYNEIMGFFENIDEEHYKEKFENYLHKEFFKERNVLKSIYNYWLGYNHPEYYNVFMYEGLCDVIYDWVDSLKKKEA